MRSDRSLSPLALSLVLSLCALVSAPARADDPPAPPAPPAGTPTAPKPLPAIDHPALNAMVGSYTVAAMAMGAQATGVARIQKAAGGTALLQEVEIVVGERTVRSLSVLRVADGGKSIRIWRFDSLGNGDAKPYHGELLADGFDASGDDGFALHVRKKDAGIETKVEVQGKPFSTSVYSRSDKDAEFTMPDAEKEGLRAQAIGTWAVAGTWVMPGPDGKPTSSPTKGTSTFRWGLGGTAIVHEYDMVAGEEHAQAVGVHRWPRGEGAAKTTKVWFFANDQVEPLVAEGPSTETGWTGKGMVPGMGEMTLKWAKKGEGFEMAFEFGGQPAGSETYTRKK